MINKEARRILSKAKQYGRLFKNELGAATFTARMIEEGNKTIVALIDMIKMVVAEQVYAVYDGFFSSYAKFLQKCSDMGFLEKNIDLYIASLDLFIENMTELENYYEKMSKVCACCGNEVFYLPLSEYYNEQKKKYHAVSMKPETLNREEYTCPFCGSSDRDRMIVSFLKKRGLSSRTECRKCLHIAPAFSVQKWMEVFCPSVVQDTTDMYMDGVTFHADIQNMDMVENETYDMIICSHVLEHVRDDGKAMREMGRVLKPDGIILFLVPVDLGFDGIDEEWGLSEAENWQRFGQNDHCRRYGKEGLIQRLKENGFLVNALGKEYFGDEVFFNAGLTDTSTLYVLAKQDVKIEDCCGHKESTRWLR